VDGRPASIFDARRQIHHQNHTESRLKAWLSADRSAADCLPGRPSYTRIDCGFDFADGR
jgi:hypothetical protein